ncbi:transaldolase family protein [Tessaracoccus flavus]|uniref:Transaldolase n=1 Tax=Tessaracoccus flavus TaxID=1610493 RepID=A0A1Q2CIW5_9ACTN|nr:transaldolase family protein [Tessaracoccus flavus]AQP45990.1 transaldolase [Tessaracoccus flavus]SDY29705.1 transaldolase [Tessaracoccus flavus]
MTDQYTPGPLLEAARNTPTALWNDSSDLEELKQSISFGGVGATCNPVIAYTTISQHLDVWKPRIKAIADANPTWGESEIGWQAVKDMSIEAAEILKPIYDEHKGRNGRLSVQTDPRLHRDAKALADQAEEFHQLAENIVVKIPATKTGLEAIEDATSRGVSINVTVSFSVPQAVRAAEAIERGLQKREAEGHDVSEMGPVVTIMVGRLDDWLKHVVARDKLFIDPSALEWAGVACMKKAYQIFKERGFRARVLSAAFRNVHHWSELVGGDLVVSPPFKWQQIINGSDYEPTSRIEEPVRQEYLDELMKIEDFRRAYDVDGMTLEEFEEFGPTRKTLRQFLQADADLDALVRDVLVPAP